MLSARRPWRGAEPDTPPADFAASGSAQLLAPDAKEATEACSAPTTLPPILLSSCFSAAAGRSLLPFVIPPKPRCLVHAAVRWRLLQGLAATFAALSAGCGSLSFLCAKCMSEMASSGESGGGGHLESHLCSSRTRCAELAGCRRVCASFGGMCSFRDCFIRRSSGIAIDESSH